MFFEIFTLFPDMFKGPFSESIIARAREKELIDINITDIRDYTEDKHNTTDDYPYGGGAGMLMKIGPIYRALKDMDGKRNVNYRKILLTPQGKTLKQDMIKEYSKEEGLLLICGHYEGIDERIRDNLITDEVSVGDYVLTGGEIPAMIIVDSIARMIPGVLGDEQSSVEDSFYHGLLDYPQYTRPREFINMKVPDILLSGDHGKIARWRKKESLRKTYLRRPDLLDNRELSYDEKNILAEIKGELNESNGK